MSKSKEQSVKEFIGEITTLSNKIRMLEKRAADFGTGELLTTFEIHVIDAIGADRGKTVSELAEWFMVTKGAISQVVGKLNHDGYVIKERNPDNGKEILLSLTPKGRKAMKGHAEFHESIDKPLLAEFDDVPGKAFEDLRRLVSRVNHHLNRYIAVLK
jgi:DNA-binding MarR family transcriptional regulator